MEMWENQEVPWLEMQGDLIMQGKLRKVADRAAELAAPKEKWHQIKSFLFVHATPFGSQ